MKNIILNSYFLLPNSGFTLIEILVVASLIGLLSTIGYGGFQAVTRSGRDALRKSDLEQLRSALEIYKSENSAYPDATNCKANITSDYINPYPDDPKLPEANYCYQLLSPLAYQLCAHLENGGSSDECGGSNACTKNCNYKVINP